MNVFDDLPLCLAIWGVHPSWPPIAPLPTNKHAAVRNGAELVGGRFARRNVKR